MLKLNLFPLFPSVDVCASVRCMLSSTLQFVCLLSRAVICFIQFGFQTLWLLNEANAFLLSKERGVITLHLNFVLFRFRIITV